MACDLAAAGADGAGSGLRADHSEADTMSVPPTSVALLSVAHRAAAAQHFFHACMAISLCFFVTTTVADSCNKQKTPFREAQICADAISQKTLNRPIGSPTAAKALSAGGA